MVWCGRDCRVGCHRSLLLCDESAPRGKGAGASCRICSLALDWIRVSRKSTQFSDESIFDVTPMKGRKFSFREVVANEYREKGALSKDEIEDLRERWNNTSGGTVHVQSPESGHVKPGGAKEVVFQGPRSSTEDYWIEFRDSMARKWLLELDNREPQRVRDDRDREYKRRDIFLRREAYLQYRKKQKELNLWLDKNLG